MGSGLLGQAIGVLNIARALAFIAQPARYVMALVVVVVGWDKQAILRGIQPGANRSTTLCVFPAIDLPARSHQRLTLALQHTLLGRRGPAICRAQEIGESKHRSCVGIYQVRPTWPNLLTPSMSRCSCRVGQAGDLDGNSTGRKSIDHSRRFPSD